MRLFRTFSLLALATCSTTPATPAPRFANQPTVWRVDDRQEVHIQPKPVRNMIEYDYYDRSFEQPITDALDIKTVERAKGVNALDEVPDSTWFTNRIGVRDLTPAEIKNGPLTDDGPEPHKPWSVLSTKSGGASAGLIVVDKRGDKYLIKFESPGYPEIESGAAIVVNRLLWALGYNVPEDRVVFFRPEDLVLTTNAAVKTMLGTDERRFTANELAEKLGHLTRTPDGRIRAIASKWIAGTPVSNTRLDGVREEDPNDRIPHQLRRDLRGALPMYAWVDYVDLPRGNALDVLVSDDRDPSRHYIRHYRLDFDSSLGAIGAVNHDARQGYAYSFGWGHVFGEIVQFGAAPRAWKTHGAPKLRGVAPQFTADNFDPARWKPDIQYAPFQAADVHDMLWGTKLVARFTRDQIRAAVEAGEYSDPRAVDYLTDTLVARQRALMINWFAQTAPLDGFSATADGVCFHDLAIEHGIAPASSTHYALVIRDHANRAIAQAKFDPAPTGASCATGLPFAHDGGDDYTIFQVDVVRGEWKKRVYIHVARDPATRQPRVVGVWRQ